MLLERIDTPSGRYYKTPEGFVFPSVTTILGSIDNPGIREWRAAVGEEQANKISETAAKRGTEMHLYCEQYLLGKTPQLDVMHQYLYSGLTEQLDAIEPIKLEESLYSKRLRVAGTLDCLGKYKGQLSIIDFKTTSKLKHKGEFDSYWLQTAAYSAMVYECLGLVVPNLVIIMQDLKGGECNVFKENSRNWLSSFKQIRDAYKDKQPLFSGQN